MSDTKIDWTFFRRRIFINKCTQEDLFRKWATPRGLTEWFIAKATYEYDHKNIREPDELVQTGDKYIWEFHKGTRVEGKILDMKINSLFKFTFGKKEPDSAEDVIVTVTFGKKKGLCYFDILQENMAESQYGKVYYYISCNMGWVFHMMNLKSIYEAGHDLRVKDESRMHVDAPSGYPLDQYRWTDFRLLEFIKVSKEAVFKQWAIKKNIVKWFLADAVYQYDGSKTRKPNEVIQAGDKYTWFYYQGIEVKGTILSLIDNEYLSFTFGKKEPGSDEDVIVEVHFISENENKTRIELYQKNISDTEYGHVNFNLSCILGWSYFLTNLRSVLESGYDVREKDKELALEARAYTLERSYK